MAPPSARRQRGRGSLVVGGGGGGGSTGGGGGGGGGGTASAWSSTGSVSTSPSRSSIRVDTDWCPSFSTRSSCVPERDGPCQGVVPRGRPSRRTRAPGGRVV